MSIRIVTDSTSDLPQEIATEYGIIVVPAYINIGDRSYLDGVELSREEFYTGLPKYKTLPTTSAPGLGAFIQAYEQLAAQGATGILSIHISASLSAILNVAHSAAQTTDVVPVAVFDSGQLTLGAGLLVLAAAKAAAAGHSMAEILALLKERAWRTYTFAALDTLEFLRRSGRVSQLQYGLGTLLKVKPLLKMHNGEMSMERLRTRKRAYERLIGLVSDLGPLEELALVHTHAPEAAEALHRQALYLFPKGKTPLSAEVTPVIGAHVGPGAVGFACIAAPTE
jgi:DegV family protein with EDD domain